MVDTKEETPSQRGSCAPVSSPNPPGRARSPVGMLRHGPAEPSSPRDHQMQRGVPSTVNKFGKSPLPPDSLRHLLRSDPAALLSGISGFLHKIGTQTPAMTCDRRGLPSCPQETQVTRPPSNFVEFRHFAAYFRAIRNPPFTAYSQLVHNGPTGSSAKFAQSSNLRGANPKPPGKTAEAPVNNLRTDPPNSKIRAI